jgi:hypothetical protein
MTDVRDRLREASDLVSGPAQPFERLVARRDRRRRRERIVAGVVAMALAIAVVGGALLVLSRTGGNHGVRKPSSGSTGAHGKGAAQVSSKLAAHLAMGDGQFFYLKSTIVTPDGNIVNETWWASDGSGRVAFDCTIPNCDNVWSSGPTGTFGPGKFPTDSDVASLSTDPAVLAGQLLERTGPNGQSPEPGQISPGPELTPGVSAGSEWRAITELLRDPNTEPDLRAAIYQVAKTVPGVQVLDATTDPAGRAGLGLAFPYDGGQVVEYDFDPDTLQLLAIQSGATSGSDTGYSVYELGIVDSTDQPPTGDQWLTPEITGPLPPP